MIVLKGVQLKPKNNQDARAEGRLKMLDLTARVLGGKDRERRAEILLEEFGAFDRLALASTEELKAVGGLSPQSAERLAAAFALGRGLSSQRKNDRLRFLGGRSVWEFVQDSLRDLEQEVFETLLLDARNGLIRRVRVSMGTLTGSLVHPREVFRTAVREAAAAIVLIHNHPSGDPSPSPEDIEVTERLVAVGELIGIRVLDHVVVGDGVYVSFAERGLIAATVGPRAVVHRA